jgi:hypothetical protein
MKIFKSFILLVAAFAISSCDSPRGQRKLIGNDKSLNNGLFFPNGSDGNRPTVGTGTPTIGGPLITPDAEHCQWSSDGVNGYASSSAHIGNYTLCLSSTSAVAGSRDVYIQTKNSTFESQICIFPTYNSGTQSFYIGEARCLMIQSNQTVYKVSLLKNRPGYQDYNITGAMIMKDKLNEYPLPYYNTQTGNQRFLTPDAYSICINWLAQTGDGSYCTAFQEVQEYIYHQF